MRWRDQPGARYGFALVDELTYFAPQPALADLPAVMPSPFATAPHPIARRAADELRARMLALGLGALVDAPGGGKMFGALVVRDRAGRVGYLAAFSGMLGGEWQREGFAPPVFDVAARDATWPAGEAELAVLAQAHADAVAREARARAALVALEAAQAIDDHALRTRHAAQRAARHAARAAADPAALAALAQASRNDTTERRRLDAAHAAAREPLVAALATRTAEVADLDAQRADRSRALWAQILDGYVIPSAGGERRPIRTLFDPAPVPGGAGDCAAPKLLARAYALGLTPIALAEQWWGAPPATGGRHAGGFYPACRGKCGPIVPFMLDGLDAEAGPIFGADAVPADAPRILHEDAWLVVVDKPCGLLSVPGRSGALRDSVLTRLRARLQADGPMIVHRLDLDTSGVMLVAKDAATHAALQQQFARRTIAKRYVAILEREVRGEHGTIDLALRVDLEDRPRQIVDAIHGKAAHTGWRVLARAGGRTRIELTPHTGRTHQLRVHAAHPQGLAAPIVGDRLYGTVSAERLMLHAEALAFAHPHTGGTIAITVPAPF
ncbi:MAG: RluA family pseudouridine synthase [Deltaproteobacteria bacterium]|nr:RluA family pseudouridine synthase [Deltaproteobacteria bacterium]